jgi:hypothetical protein
MQPTMHLVWRYILRWRSPTSTILAWACTFLSWYILCQRPKTGPSVGGKWNKEKNERDDFPRKKSAPTTGKPK